MSQLNRKKQCKICGKKLKNLSSIGSHLRVHKIKIEDYYIKYYLDNKIPLCYCGRKTKFSPMTSNFRKYCSVNCANNYDKNPN